LLEEQGTSLNYLSKYYEVSKRLQREPRFRSIEERDREEVFQEFIERLGEKERENRRLQSLQRVEQLKEEFRNVEKVNLETRWKDIVALVEEKGAGKPIYSEASQMDLLTAFEDVMKEMERDDAQTKK